MYKISTFLGVLYLLYSDIILSDAHFPSKCHYCKAWFVYIFVCFLDNIK